MREFKEWYCAAKEDTVLAAYLDWLYCKLRCSVVFVYYALASSKPRSNLNLSCPAETEPPFSRASASIVCLVAIASPMLPSVSLCAPEEPVRC